MPERRCNVLSPWLRAGALAALLALSACDNGPEQPEGEKQPAPADNGAAQQSEPPATTAPEGKLETRQETLRRRADNCSGDDCAKVAVDLELYEGHPELNQAVRRRMIRQLGGNGEDQGAPPKTLEEAADRFLTTAAGIPGDGARGWELSGESRQLGRWKDLLTVAIDSYEFTGGAHGLPVTRWLNWDLTAHRPVSLGQVINPGQEDAFEAAARRAHERWLEKEVDSDEDFRQAWPFQESSDFRLTRKGLVLHYDVYSIAPYVMGQPTLTLPWKDLEGVIREEYRPDGGQ
ncbi:MAG TPA: hypothetical protein DIT60_03895 [Alcanivorax sp.]|jgi:hypothetical protein|nr:hypothetical protein [Alcanivorax sp.]|tara:strand:- start:1970 stop:2839 length:870 start_codon:yes stop_codon:yes gene_type:complete